MAEQLLPVIARPIHDLVYIQIDPDWIAHHEGGWSSPLGDTLPFIFMDLEDGIEESGSVNYADFEVVGRAESYKSYIGAANKEFPLTFKFRAQGVDSDDLFTVLVDEVQNPALWLDALKYPYTGADGLSHAPPPCLLSLGELFFGRVIATDVQISWQAPFDANTFLPFGADVTCTFTRVREHIKNYSHSWSR